VSPSAGLAAVVCVLLRCSAGEGFGEICTLKPRKMRKSYQQLFQGNVNRGG